MILTNAGSGRGVDPYASNVRRVEVLEFLKKWVTEHIRKCDKLYPPFFRDKPLR